MSESTSKRRVWTILQSQSLGALVAGACSSDSVAQDPSNRSRRPRSVRPRCRQQLSASSTTDAGAEPAFVDVTELAGLPTNSESQRNRPTVCSAHCDAVGSTDRRRVGRRLRFRRLARPLRHEDQTHRRSVQEQRRRHLRRRHRGRLGSATSGKPTVPAGETSTTTATPTSTSRRSTTNATTSSSTTARASSARSRRTRRRLEQPVPAHGRSVNFGDYDRDGWLDMYVAGMADATSSRQAARRMRGCCTTSARPTRATSKTTVPRAWTSSAIRSARTSPMASTRGPARSPISTMTAFRSC